METFFVGRLVILFVSTVTVSTAQTNLFLNLVTESLKDLDWMQFLPAPDIIRREGYSCEIHHANSSNYRLEMHRIPHAKRKFVPSKGIPVLFIHGFGCSGDIFILNRPGMSLAYILADNGYDVWLGNVRGNKYSRYNYDLPEDSPDIWKFCVDDNVDDTAIMIDYILEVTHKPNLYFIGHSSGNAIGFMLFASKPYYKFKVKGHLALGPSPVLSSVDKRAASFVPIINAAKMIVNAIPNLGIFLEFPPDLLRNKIVSFFRNVIYAFGAVIAGDGFITQDLDRISLYSSRTFAGTSIRYLQQLLPLFTENITMYDYGPLENIGVYGKPSTPDYNYEKNEVPTYLYVAKNDIWADSYGANITCRIIKNCKGVFVTGNYNSGHAWLFLGKDAHLTLYPMMMSVMT